MMKQEIKFIEEINQILLIPLIILQGCEDGSYEVTVDNQTGKEKHILYIGGNPYESDIIYLKDYNEQEAKYKFLHKDYLGSILAISDEEGNKIEQRHYDAWGNLTHLQIGKGEILTGDKLQKATSQMLIDRGYTSHEHFFEVGIIHMNGRLYDPLLRRFLNADEFIQDPHNTQNYNKYGYVFNNPLMFNDPNGEVAWFVPLLIAVGKGALIGAAVGAGIYLVQAAITGNFSLKDFGKSILMGAISGAVSGGIAHLELFSSAGLVGGGILNGVLGGSITGGIDSLINGTNFVKGVFKGAVIGGVIGGITGLIQRLTLKPQEISIDTAGEKITTGDSFKNTEDLIDFTNKNIGDVETIKNELNIRNFKSEGHIKYGNIAYGVEQGGIYKYDVDIMGNYINKTLTNAGGTTIPVKNTGWFSKLKTDVLISPKVKGIYYNNASLAKMVINHEFIHAYHFKTIGHKFINTNFSEASAYNYTLRYLSHYKITGHVFSTFYNTAQRYGWGFQVKPYNYSWNIPYLHKLLKLF